jgi:adenylate cyclase
MTQGRSAKKTPRALRRPTVAVSGTPAAPNPTQKVYLANVRHQLRTPINHIIGYSEMLQEEDDVPPGFLPDLKKIHVGGQQLLALINDYFDDEKFGTGNRALHQVFHELRTPVNHIIGYSEMLQEQAEELGFQRLVPDLKKIHAAAQNWLALMESHLIPANVTLGKKPAHSAAPRGAARLKFAPATPDAAGPTAAEHGFLLVADDDEANRDLLARRLSKLGYTVTSAENGRQALKLLKSEKFDLVLLDMIMPDIDGYQVLQKMKTDPQLHHVPVIMISALDQVEGIVRCIELGAEDYLAKPFDPVFLRARIGAALEKKRLYDWQQIYLKQIEAEQAKVERLLLNVLPRAIADRLKQSDEPIVDSFAEATVLFADLVGFTSFSAQISPAVVVRLLNDIFSAFDVLAERHGLEKIKTIGDAYMAVAGLPVPRADHAEKTAELALDMRTELEQFNRIHGTSLRMRIGINTGPAIAGIIGKHKFIYDLWGDTVNTASRMESHGVPGCIQVTAVTHELLREKFHCEKRGTIKIKDKGPMTTYFLISRKPPATALS